MLGFPACCAPLVAVANNCTTTLTVTPNYAPVLSAVLYCLVFGILLAVSVIDTWTMEIPNCLIIALLICGIVAIFIIPNVSILSRIIGLVCVSVPLLVCTLVAPGSFGGGDIKLMAAAGFLLGWQNTLVAACIGILAGGVYGVLLMVFRKKGVKEHFPFGPALCAGIALALLFGTQINAWYLGVL